MRGLFFAVALSALFVAPAYAERCPRQPPPQNLDSGFEHDRYAPDCTSNLRRFFEAYVSCFDGLDDDDRYDAT